MVRFFNTLSGRLEEFKPPKEGVVGMYTCGPTVYDYAHIGNFRTFVFEDLLRRFLEFKGFKVKHVMNLTDVDDKTIAGAQKEGRPLAEFTQKYAEAFNEDLKTLNILPPTKQPRATQEIPAMIQLIEQLIKNGAAYESDGSVYYRVASFPRYGKLSKKNLEKNIKGARVDVDEYDKEEGADFALWKRAREGEPSWDSPWGKGRPGWHIECSSMSMKYLGETFDIHAGGEDLIFPHHENEIAQSEAATGKPFVKYWLHSKHLLVNGEKMSKSKGNFFTLRDLLAKGYDPMAIRYALLSTHYHTPLNFTLEGLEDAKEVIKRFDDCYWQCMSRKLVIKELIYRGVDISSMLERYTKDIQDSLSADLNISTSLAHFALAVKQINARISEDKLGPNSLESALAFFKRLDRLFGFKITEESKISEGIEALMKKRFEVRCKIKDQDNKSLWLVSDKLRNEIQNKGWLVKDGRPGELSTVKKKRRAWDFEKT